MTRRELLPAALTIVPRHVLGGTGYTAPSDKLVLAGIGVGGVGVEYLKGCESETIGALCDVDHAYAARVFKKYPQAKVYKDFRVMLDQEKGIDAVVIGTPDHTHAVIAAAAMNRRKHVYCAKPMARTIQEARTLARIAREKKVATQMSVQSCASDEACATEEWIRAGLIGKVREIHIWSDRPVWPQGMLRPRDTPPVPKDLDWDLFLGPAKERPYHSAYHPFVWRGWTDFGTGAIGDMACHALHIPFRALGLRYPMSVMATASQVVESSLEMVGDEPRLRPKLNRAPETFPHASIVTWDYEGGVRLIWYDGGIRPSRPVGLSNGRAMPTTGMYLVGDKGILMSGFTGGPVVVGRRVEAPPKSVPRTTGHYSEWIDACKGGPPANCNFDFASVITETALLGAMAQRLPGRYMEWDWTYLRFINSLEGTAMVNPPARDGWAIA